VQVTLHAQIMGIVTLAVRALLTDTDCA